jgi:hypothetical protein
MLSASGRTQEEPEEKNSLYHEELEQASKQTEQLAQQFYLLYWYKRTNTDSRGAGAGAQADRAASAAVLLALLVQTYKY